MQQDLQRLGVRGQDDELGLLTMTNKRQVLGVLPNERRVLGVLSNAGRSTDYRVVINERHNVLHYCDPILSPGDFLSLLGAYQIWSI